MCEIFTEKLLSVLLARPGLPNSQTRNSLRARVWHSQGPKRESSGPIGIVQVGLRPSLSERRVNSDRRTLCLWVYILHAVKMCPWMLTGSPATSHSFVRFSISIYTSLYRYTICVMEATTLPYFDQLLRHLTFYQRNP